MKIVPNFLKTHKYAFIWTACYIFVMWAILHFMFNFDMFSGTDWTRLAHSKLYGFPGFVFGLLILSAIPLYIATTAIIIRKKKPLFTIPLPKIMEPVPDEAHVKPETKQDTSPQSAEPAAPQQTPTNELPRKIPAELRHQFIRAQNSMGPMQHSVFDTPNITAINEQEKNTSNQPPSAQSTNGLPLPNDFDIPSENIDPDINTINFTPVFQDIDFDESDTKPESLTAPDINPTTKQSNDENQTIIKYLESHNIKFTIENGIVITDHDAIATHNDPDFWIADNETWFAAGRQKPSPADAVLSISAARGVRPVLYLEQTNIMDFDARRAQWRDDGITVITSPSELD